MLATRCTLAVLVLSIATNAIEITNLPGQPAANFKQYSDYLSVGKNGNHRLHYWFVESQNNPATDPVLLWLTGGPGCSGLSALLEEWGPFMINPDGITLRVNPYSWNKNASVLTLEAPAGVGFSYSTDGNIITSDAETAEENWEALKAFFSDPLFSKYRTNDFYVTGESYGGIYVPTLVQKILDNQSQFNINIKGFAIGNGCVDMNEDTDALMDFLYAHGLIDDTQWQKVKTQCCNNSTDDCPFHTMTQTNFCGEFVQASTQKAWNGGLNPYNMYADCAPVNGGQLPLRFVHDYKRKMNTDIVPPQVSAVVCMDESAVTTYLNRADVRKALAIPTTVHKWAICSNAISVSYQRQVTETSSNFKSAISQGLRAMLYSGDVDMACNYLMGQRFSRKLGYPLTSAKTKYMVSGQVGGFHTKYGSQLDFVTVRGAGHMVPTDKPEIAAHIINSFLFKKPF